MQQARGPAYLRQNREEARRDILKDLQVVVDIRLIHPNSKPLGRPSKLEAGECRNSGSLFSLEFPRR